MTAEQQARDLLERVGVQEAQSFSSGDVLEIANLIAERQALLTALRVMVGIYVELARRSGEREPESIPQVQDARRALAFAHASGNR
jgi:hypothetical protein